MLFRDLLRSVDRHCGFSQYSTCCLRLATDYQINSTVNDNSWSYVNDQSTLIMGTTVSDSKQQLAYSLLCRKHINTFRSSCSVLMVLVIAKGARSKVAFHKAFILPLAPTLLFWKKAFDLVCARNCMYRLSSLVHLAVFAQGTVHLSQQSSSKSFDSTFWMGWSWNFEFAVFYFMYDKASNRILFVAE
jgi:hypothetical protein